MSKTWRHYWAARLWERRGADSCYPWPASDACDEGGCPADTRDLCEAVRTRSVRTWRERKSLCHGGADRCATVMR